jgi:hypothetical protein
VAEEIEAAALGLDRGGPALGRPFGLALTPDLGLDAAL